MRASTWSIGTGRFLVAILMLVEGSARSSRINSGFSSSRAARLPRTPRLFLHRCEDAGKGTFRRYHPSMRDVTARAGAIMYPPVGEGKADDDGRIGKEVKPKKYSESFVARFQAKDADVVVRPIRTEDAEDIYEAINSNRDHLERWLPQMRGAFSSVREVQYNVDYWLWKMETARGLVLGVEVDGKVRGIMAINIIDWKNSCGYLGYWLTADVQGKGIATIGMQHVIRIAQEQLHLDHLDISTMQDNERSKALAERLGFIHHPDIQDFDTQYLWGILPVRQINLDVFTRSRDEAEVDVQEARQHNFWFNLRNHIRENMDPVEFKLESKQFYRKPRPDF